MKDILIEVYGRCLFYEHGKIGSSLMMTDGHMHCYHAHLHCIPTDINLNDIIEKELHAKSSIDYESCYNEMQKVDKYLYVEDDKIMTYVPDIKIRRQYLRYKLAEALDIIDRWDWVEEQNWDIIEQTIKRLKGYFK